MISSGLNLSIGSAITGLFLMNYRPLLKMTEYFFYYVRWFP
ncbi:hypothetical protein LEP1GSC195_3807 [Leptospira wolbachii serovar Codice str. CDC]|uniref:Uncharacterized protein n=1 Tax=Leptospira wolbachii serovar Codice str. CDC TaxID=1218599 RepID=R9A0P0_9LEPT|nr:hypothetical protein LEP1GSC195_3807 [Leptospira wolbachii serovar Codice str. CDC]